MLQSGRPDLTFYLCWANYNWNWRRGDKDRQARVIVQKYSNEDDRAYIRWLLDVFQYERYIKIDGRRRFLLYRMFDLPDPLGSLITRLSYPPPRDALGPLSWIGRRPKPEGLWEPYLKCLRSVSRGPLPPAGEPLHWPDPVREFRQAPEAIVLMTAEK